MPKILAVLTSEKKGTKKEGIDKGYFKENFGLTGDAHASSQSHRQVSLLAMESINKMNELGWKLGPGDFAENLTTRGIDLPSLPVGTLLAIGDNVLLKISQIGKECHTGCAILKETGKCIMPKEGIFARVLRSGEIKTGDKISIGGE